MNCRAPSWTHLRDKNLHHFRQQLRHTQPAVQVSHELEGHESKHGKIHLLKLLRHRRMQRQDP